MFCCLLDDGVFCRNTNSLTGHAYAFQLNMYLFSQINLGKLIQIICSIKPKEYIYFLT